MRGDLGMSKGKLCSQAGHAYVGSILLCKDPAVLAEYHRDFPQSPGTKVCLKAPGLDPLLHAQKLAQAAGLSSFLVVDSGCPNFFEGKPTVTALGIGPATQAQIEHITGGFPLL